MTAPSRFEIVASLPSPRRHLHVAVDRESSPPRAVVLALYPRTLSDDPGRLARLSGEMERAARLFHPNVLAPVGIEAVGGDLAAVTVWRDAITLRELLDAGGRLPSDVAARIAVDVCAGLAHAHGRPEPVVHGLLQPDAVLLDESGLAVVAGFGMPGGSSASDDLLGVGELLHELLAGEPPEDPSAPLDVPGVPEALAAVVRQARALEPEARPSTAEALGEGLARAVPIASHGAVAAYVEAIVPPGSGLRAERRRKIEAAIAALAAATPEEISEQDIVEAATPAPGEVVALEPAAAPVAPGGASISRESPSREDPVRSDPEPAPPSAAPASIPTPVPSSTAHSTGKGTGAVDGSPPVHPVSRTARGGRVPLWVAIAMCLGGIAIGFALARLGPRAGFAGAPEAAPAEAPVQARAVPPEPSPAATSTQQVGPPPVAAPRPVSKSTREKKRASVRRAAASAPEKEAGMAFLEVSAPGEAEVWLDGRLVGEGSTRRPIREGSHRVEVRHRGARVGESFHVAPGETWKYVVTPRG